MKWRVVEYDNAISERGMQVVSDDGTIICCNEPYYPTALDPKHAHLIAAGPAMLEALKAIEQGAGMHPENMRSIARDAIAAAEVQP